MALQMTSKPSTRSQRVSANVALLLECEEEKLSDAQKKAQETADKEYAEAMEKMNNMLKTHKVMYKGKEVMVLQNGNFDPPKSTSIAALTPVPALVAKTNLAVKPTVTPVVRATPNQPGRIAPTTYQLVMNQGLGNNVGYLVGTVASSVPNTRVIQGNMTTAKTSTPLQLSTAGNRPLMQPSMVSANSVLKIAPQPKTLGGKVTIPNISAGEGVNRKLQIQIQPTNKVPNIPTLQSGAQHGSVGQIQPQTVQNVNVSMGANVPTVDLTDGDEDRADSREMVFNKLSGKTFPSLVVLARPSLKIKDFPVASTSKERAAMDSRIKAVLIYSPTKFTEWLIQQGMVRSEQCCTSHFGPDSKPVKLKLGMYSDASKFPYSGGYVWISDCCPQRFVSVFSGSLFEGAPHPPTVLLKLIYHWSCQTSVANVVQWVKVDNFYVKNFFTHLRAVCTAAVHTKMGLLGGIGRFVEVGVISLGTTSHDGQSRQVKVEVLGVLDKEAKLVRLRAIEPMIEGDRNLKRRFAKILEPLVHWVHPGSTVLTDYSIDKATLHSIGFNNVHQANASEGGVLIGGTYHSNQNIMEYLRKIVPRMFLNTLSLLNRSLIQQFLDELTWRECYGPLPAQAFDNLIAHIAEQTKVEHTDPLVKRLNNISANPFKNWNYLETPARSVTVRIAPANAVNYMIQSANDFSMDVSPQSLCEVQYAPGPASSKRPKSQKQSQIVVQDYQLQQQSPAGSSTAVKRIKLNTNDQTYLDSYYYADMKGNQSSILEDMDANFSVKCVVCPSTFSNNIALMKHTISHVIYESSDQNTKRFLFCPYCLKRMQTTAQLSSHKKECHQNTTAAMACSICQCRFTLRQALIKHMHSQHEPSEMPYRCGVCQLRSSSHLKVVDHFYEAHVGGCSLQCPLCLKVFYACGLRSRGNYVNLMGYYQHLVGHKRQSQRRKCERCVLVFQQSKQVTEHEQYDHKSMRNVSKVVPVVSTESSPTIIIPLPKGAPTPLQAARVTTTAANRNYTSVPHSMPLSIKANPSQNCLECNQPLVQRYHLSTVMSCLRCKYVTCCLASMELHAKKFHTNQKNKLQTGKDTQLPKPMFCICGFSSQKGNVLATHLAECEKRSAYPSLGVFSQSASFPPLVTLDDGPVQDPDDQWMKAYMKPNGDKKEESPTASSPVASTSASGSMLDVLGLVRKPTSDEDVLPPSKKIKVDTEETSSEPIKDKEEVADTSVNKDDDVQPNNDAIIDLDSDKEDEVANEPAVSEPMEVSEEASEVNATEDS